MNLLRAARRLKTRAFAVREMGVLLVLIGLSLALAVRAPGFAEVENLLLVARQFSMFATMGVGMTMVILTGGIDLSVGSVLALSGCVAAKCMLGLTTHADPLLVVFAGIVTGLATGLVCGIINGLIVAKVGIPPFIVTLGMMSIARGLVYVMTRGWPVSVPEEFLFLGQGRIWIVPVPVVCMVVIAVGGALFLSRTRLGRHIYAVGGNEEAARLSGINVAAVKLVVYAVCGLLAGFAGITTASYLIVAQPSSGLTNELDVIAAVIVGGTSLAGGSGTVLGTVIGAALMGVLRNGLVLLGVSANWQLVPLGIVIIAAVVFDQLRQRRGERVQVRAAQEEDSTDARG
jgi:ribose transport system permease protein